MSGGVIAPDPGCDENGFLSRSLLPESSSFFGTSPSGAGVDALLGAAELLAEDAFFLPRFAPLGFVWILLCRVSSSDLLNRFSQPGKVQACGFSPVNHRKEYDVSIQYRNYLVI